MTDVAEMVARDGLEQSNGRAMFAAVGVPGWHNLGTVFPVGHLATREEMLTASLLAKWNLRLVDAAELFTTANFVTPTFHVVRDNPFGEGTDVLSTVGARYNIVDNEALAEFLENIAAGGARWDTMGSIRNGRTVFANMILDTREFVLDPDGANDVIHDNLMVTSSHDGTSAVMVKNTPTRVVCQNTLAVAVRGVGATFKARHTDTVKGRIADARKALGIAFAHNDAFAAEVNALYATKVSDEQFQSIVESLYPRPKLPADADKSSVKRSETRYATKRETLTQSWNGDNLANVKGTAWGALNALTFPIDHLRTARGSKDSDPLVAASAKESIYEAQVGADNAVNTEKQRITDAIASWARKANPLAFA